VGSRSFATRTGQGDGGPVPALTGIEGIQSQFLLPPQGCWPFEVFRGRYGGQKGRDGVCEIGKPTSRWLYSCRPDRGRRTGTGAFCREALGLNSVTPPFEVQDGKNLEVTPL